MTQLKSPRNSANSDSDRTDKSNSRISPWLAKTIYPLGCYLVIPGFFGKIKISGREHIPSQGPTIVAPTHRSRWDAAIVPYTVGRLASGRDLRFMVSSNEVKGIQGWIIRRMGGFPIDTDRPQLNSVRHSVELLKSSPEMLVIFPEGGIFNDNQIHPLKRGVAAIALQADDGMAQSVKILPVAIRYSQPYPTWGTDVRVDIAAPIAARDFVGKSLRRSSQKLTTALQESLEELYES